MLLQVFKQDKVGIWQLIKQGSVHYYILEAKIWSTKMEQIQPERVRNVIVYLLGRYGIANWAVTHVVDVLVSRCVDSA